MELIILFLNFKFYLILVFILGSNLVIKLILN